MDEVRDIRSNIDEVDKKMLELLNKRAELALQIKKTNLGKAPIRPEREASIVHDLTVNNPGPLPDKAVREIFTQIIASFRDRLQLDRPVSVSYLGPAGTYSEEAVMKLFGSTVDLHAEDTIMEVIRSVDAGSSNLAVVPIENSTEGAVRETHKLLQDTSSKIVAEISLPILHCLLTNSSLDKIKTVYAHPQALGQCRLWISKHLPNAKTISTTSNSAAAELAASHEDSAAIASQNAADIYKLKVGAIGINDQPGNETRFVALGDLKTHPTGRDKTSMIIVLNDKPGALHEALGVLAKNSISMTRLESHPYTKGQYGFYIDFIGHIDEAPVTKALNDLRTITRTCQILGSYPIEAGK